jgi:hypothetical protein
MSGVNTTRRRFFFFFVVVALTLTAAFSRKISPTAAIVLMDLNRKKNLVVSSQKKKKKREWKERPRKFVKNGEITRKSCLQPGIVPPYFLQTHRSAVDRRMIITKKANCCYTT